MPTNTKALQVAEPAGIVAGKNAVINGGMDIWQRGTSFTSFANNSTYTVDRFTAYRGAYASGMTVSRQNTSDTTNLPNIQYCARISRDNANTGTDQLFFRYTIETVNSIPFTGKTITFSFYARKGANFSAASNALSANVYYGTGTDQNIANFTGSTAFISQTATLTTTWQRFSYTGTVATTSTELGFDFSFIPVGTAGAADYFEVTGVQLELGSVATPFSRAGGTIQGELAACQRYFYSSNPYNSTDVYGSIALGYCTNNAGTQFEAFLYLPVTMRTKAASVAYSNVRLTDYTSAYTISSVALESARQSNGVAALLIGVTGLTQWRPYSLEGNNNSAAYIQLSAEL